MISRFEYLYLKSKVKRIEDALFDVEMTPGSFFQEWEKFEALGKEGKAKVYAEWDKYYEACADTSYGKRFFSCKVAFDTHNMGLLQQSVIENENDSTPMLKKPGNLDPREIYMLMGPVFAARGEMAQTQRVVNEYAPVYEKKDKKTDEKV